MKRTHVLGFNESKEVWKVVHDSWSEKRNEEVVGTASYIVKGWSNRLGQDQE